MGILLFVLAVVAVVMASIAVVPPPASEPTCQGLNGSPNASTGLDEDTCLPRIEGLETWTPRSWDASGFAELRSWTLDASRVGITQNPYEATPAPLPDPKAVCGVLVTGDHTYRLKTFSEETTRRASRPRGALAASSPTVAPPMPVRPCGF